MNAITPLMHNCEFHHAPIVNSITPPMQWERNGKTVVSIKARFDTSVGVSLVTSFDYHPECVVILCPFVYDKLLALRENDKSTFDKMLSRATEMNDLGSRFRDS